MCETLGFWSSGVWGKLIGWFWLRTCPEVAVIWSLGSVMYFQDGTLTWLSAGGICSILCESLCRAASKCDSSFPLQARKWMWSWLIWKLRGQDMVVHSCNPSTWEVEAGGLQIQCHPEMHSDTLFQKQSKKDGSWVSWYLILKVTCHHS
jgi:hypothetical protein